MPKHNYSQYANKKNDNDDMTGDWVTPTYTAVEPELVVETVETVELPKKVTGVVNNCARLNVRSKPDATADVVCVLNAKFEVEIDVTKSNDEWFSVCTAAGIEGYCMKKFVDARL